MPSIATTWTLSQTAADTVSVAVGVFAAATTDNIQPLAILACEAFGTTVAMAPETCKKVNKLCARGYESAILNFIKAQIGFRKGDCGWQLSQTDAGVRFLGLAAALLSIDYWIAADALSCLIRETAADLRLVPTSTQLKQLLKSLEYKLSHSGFVEMVLAWSLNITSATGVVASSTVLPPSRQLVMELVKSISDISRVGQSKSLQIMAPRDQAAWIIAFVEWCTGLKPSVIIKDDTTICMEPKSQITVHLLSASSLEQQAEFEITTLEDIKSVRVIVKDLPASHETVRGMVTTRVLARRLLFDFFGQKKSLPFRAFRQALPYGCALALKFLRICEESDLPDRIQQSELTHKNFIATCGNAFPSDKKVASAIMSFLGEDRPVPIPQHLDNFMIDDLHCVKMLKDDICKDCDCTECSHIPSATESLCKFDEFLNQAAICILVVLLLALLESADPEGPWLYFGGYRWFGGLSSGLAWSTINARKYIAPIVSLLQGSTTVCYSRLTLLKAMFQLLGHELEDLEDIWLMSSFRGQAVYPRLFDTMCVEGTGILSMLCVPGALMWEGEIYSYAMGPKYRISEDPHFSATQDHGKPKPSKCEIAMPTDLYPGYKASWKVSTGDGYLTVAIDCPNIPEVSPRCPFDSIVGIMRSLFVNCSHDNSAQVRRPTHDLRLTSPKQPIPYSGSGKLIGVVQCDQNDHMRFFTLATGKGGVIRANACLDCCIDSCVLGDLDFILC